MEIELTPGKKCSRDAGPPGATHYLEWTHGYATTWLRWYYHVAGGWGSCSYWGGCSGWIEIIEGGRSVAEIGQILMARWGIAAGETDDEGIYMSDAEASIAGLSSYRVVLLRTGGGPDAN